MQDQLMPGAATPGIGGPPGMGGPMELTPEMIAQMQMEMGQGQGQTLPFPAAEGMNDIPPELLMAMMEAEGLPQV